MTTSVGNNSICYEAIQRVFRNVIVEYLRRRMAEIFPIDHIDKLKKTLGKEWDPLQASAQAARDSGGTETQVKDEYDLLSVAHFFNIFDAYFDKFFATAAIQGTFYKKPVKAKLLGNLKTIKDLRDPLSHPVQEEMSFEEAFGVLVDVKQMLLSLGLSAEAAIVANLMTDLRGFDQYSGDHMVVSLPTQDSIYLDFIGRKGILEGLDEWFSSRTNKRALIAGDGGKGKSAIAYRYAKGLSQDGEHYKMVAWLSAKRRRFEEGQTVSIDVPDFTDLDSALNKLLMKFGVLRDQLSSPLNDRRLRLLRLLDEFPAFVVVDDIDSVLEDTDVVSFFTFDLPNTQSTVLLTSRRDIPGIKGFVIRGFDHGEVEDFIKSRVELYGLDPSVVSTQNTEEIAEVTDGSPLYMDDLLKLVKVVPVAKAIEMWQEKKGDEARKYALQRELERLTQDARKLLIGACVREGPISFAELQSISNFSDDRMMTALTQLQTMFLLPKPRVVEGEQRFELNSNTRKLVRLVEGNSDLYARVEIAIKAISGQLPDVGRGLIAALIRQAFLLLNSERTAEAENLMLQAIEKYPQAADLQGFLGFLYRKLDRFVDATPRFEAAFKLKSKNRDTYRHWVKMEMAQKEWTRAIAAADKGLRMIPDFFELHALRAECKLRSGHDLYSRVQREKAYKMWTDAVNEIKSALKPPDKLSDNDREINAWMYRTLVLCLNSITDFKALKQAFEQWAEQHPEDLHLSRHRELIERVRGKSIDDLASQRPEVQVTSRPKPF